MASEEELQDRYQSWVDAVLAAREVWITGNDDDNAVIEDPDEDRDLHLMFSSRKDAEAEAEEGRYASAITVEDLVEILDKADRRGDGLALWQGQSWIVADPGPLAEELRERT